MSKEYCRCQRLYLYWDLLVTWCRTDIGIVCNLHWNYNAFYGNTAAYRGSLYILESVVILSGTNTFLNNTASEILEDDDEDDSWTFRGSGGAIYCEFSTLYINSEYSKSNTLKASLLQAIMWATMEVLYMLKTLSAPHIQ